MARSSVAATAYESSAFTSPPMRTDAVVTEIAAIITTAQSQGHTVFRYSWGEETRLWAFWCTYLSITCFFLIFHQIRQKKTKRYVATNFMFVQKLAATLAIGAWCRHHVDSSHGHVTRTCLSLVRCVSMAGVPSNCIHCTTTKHMMALSQASPCAKQVVFLVCNCGWKFTMCIKFA